MSDHADVQLPFDSMDDLRGSIENLQQKLDRERRAWVRLEHEYDIKGEPSYIAARKRAVTHDTLMTDAAFAELRDALSPQTMPRPEEQL